MNPMDAAFILDIHSLFSFCERHILKRIQYIKYVTTPELVQYFISHKQIDALLNLEKRSDIKS